MQTLTKPSRKSTRRFGQGLGERHPIYLAPADLESMAWWEMEAQREEDRLIDRMGREYEAQCRLENGYEPW